VEYIEKSIEVEVPVSTAYNQWTQFEEFPNFMGGVAEVKQLDDQRLYWVGEIAGLRKDWYARITEQIPDQRIAWRSEGDDVHAGGLVTFRPMNGRTMVTVRMEYEPEGLEAVADQIGLVERQVESDLESFKEFIESRGEETGAWRGKIQSGSTMESESRTPSGSTTRRPEYNTPSEFPETPGQSAGEFPEPPDKTADQPAGG